MTECPICIKNMSGSGIRKEIACPACDYKTCYSCLKTFILGSDKKASCMNCDREFTFDFIVENTPKVFYGTTYRDHLADIEYKREMNLLPATQPLVQQEIRNRESVAMIAALIDTKKKLQAQIRDIDHTIRSMRYSTYTPEEKVNVACNYPCPIGDCRGFLNTEWECGLCNSKVCKKCRTPKTDEHKCDPNTVESVKLIDRDTKPCPKCGCRIYKTSGCFDGDTIIPLRNGEYKLAKDIQVGDELIGDDGNKRTVLSLIQGEDMMYEIKQNKADNYIVNSEHTLVLVNGEKGEILEIKVSDFIKLNNSIKSVLYGYRTEGVNWEKNYIYTSIEVVQVGMGKFYGWEIDNNHRFVLKDFTVVKNCNHMFCPAPNCNTSFDWNTGNFIDESKNTNPLYYEYLRKRGDRMPANPVACGQPNQRLDPRLFHNKIITYCNTGVSILGKDQDAFSLSRSVAHITLIELERYRPSPIRDRNTDLRVSYMLKEIDEKTFKSTLKARHKRDEKKEDIYNVLQLYSQTMTDLQYAISTCSSLDNFKNYIRDMYKIRDYCNENLQRLRNKYDNMIPSIEDNWGITQRNNSRRR